MRQRSGALHCQTEEQLLQLASNNSLGLYYSDSPNYAEVSFQNQWNLEEATRDSSKAFQSFNFDSQFNETRQEEKELSRGQRYLNNCIVDRETIRCGIQICLITSKIEEVISKLVGKESLVNFFIHSRDGNQNNCLYKHSTVSSTRNSNIFCLNTQDIQCCRQQAGKQNYRLSPKNWLKNTSSDKMMELLIVKKHIKISQSCEIGPKKITIIHKIYIINQKYLQNSLLKIYLQKAHYVVNMVPDILKPTNDTFSSKKNLYEKFFKSTLEKECLLYEKGQFFHNQQTDKVKFRHLFHKIEEKIAKTYMRSLNEILRQEKRKNPQNPTNVTDK